MFHNHTDLSASLIKQFVAVEVTTAPNYRAMIMMKDELAHHFGIAMAIEMLGRMKISVSQSGIDAGNFPVLIRSMVDAVVRMHEQLVKDVGHTYARALLTQMCSEFTLEIE